MIEPRREGNLKYHGAVGSLRRSDRKPVAFPEYNESVVVVVTKIHEENQRDRHTEPSGKSALSAVK